jgi:phage-related protein
VNAEAELCWVGDAKDVLSGFPAQVKGVLGFSLRRIQQGLNPRCDTRRMASLGDGVWELKTADEKTWYRVMYLTRIGGKIHVLHAFEKSGGKTDRRDLAIVRARLKQVHEDLKRNTEFADD